MQSHYEINVAKDGQHFFATAERSIVTSHDLARIMPTFVAKFPTSEGYSINVTLWNVSGTRVDSGNVI